VTVQATFAATLVDEWVRAGVTDAVVAPGSRSTPLALALAGDERLCVHVVLDERSAGFFALGLGLGSGRPAVVLTTSGTAAVELHPAVVEADLAGVPLVACTADRPPELHRVGAPQTVEQVGLFGGACRWACDPGVPDGTTSPAWRSVASRAVAEATSAPAGPGPVHLNLPFREPLVGEPGPLPPGRPEGAPWHGGLVGASWSGAPAEAASDAVMNVLGRATRGVLVAGAGAGQPDAVHALAMALGWPVLADPRSGCRLPLPATVASADALLRCEAFAAAHRPEVVVRLGRPWASKVVNQWLGGLGPEVPQYLVDPYGRWADPERVVTTVVDADPTAWCRSVAGRFVREGATAPAEWLGTWAAAELAAQAGFDRCLAAHSEATEPGVARTLANGLADGATLVVSSSMPVRDVEWYSRPRRALRVLANRGANGIDGVVSTALGVAASGAGPTAALLGDLALLHDANGLLAPAGAARPVNCTLVVVDNGGGGIFSFLPHRSALPVERFERLFGTPQPVDVAALAAAYGVPVTEVTAAADVQPAVSGSLEAGGVRLVRVRTDRDLNVAVHDELHTEVTAALS